MYLVINNKTKEIVSRHRTPEAAYRRMETERDRAYREKKRGWMWMASVGFSVRPA